jgi:hypothetical protein
MSTAAPLPLRSLAMAMLSMVKAQEGHSSTLARWKRRFHSGMA